MTLSDRVRGDLAALLGPGLTGERWMRKNRLEVRTKKEHVEKVAHLLTRVFDARLAHVSVVDKGFHGYDVVYHYALDHAERSLHVNVKAELPLDEPEVASVSREAPEASWSEREMMELTPVRFRGHPDPRHLWLPMEWPYPAESGKYEESEVIGRKDETLGKPIEESGGWLPLGVEPKSSEASLVLLGPYHPLLIEAAYFRVKVNGEEIVDADVKLGWNHRGIMRLLESRDIHRNVYLTERICGICNVAHTTAYCTTVELLLGIDLPERARYIRTLMGELERIHSHLLWLGVAGDLIGFKTLFMLAWREREEIMDIFELISGSRRAPAMNIIGGVRLDIQEAVAAKITERLEALRGKVGRLVDIVYDHPVARSRLEDVGVLRIDTAKEAGALGPTARASNWKVDVRWSDPYAAYGDEYTTWDVVTETGGDSWARTVVRLRELIVSVDICLQALKALAGTSGPFKTEAGELNPGEALGKTEAPRGELLYYIVSDGTNIPHTVRIRTPSYRNNSVIPSLLRGSALADAPVIVGSIDPCYSCTDRMVIVEDAKTGRVETGRLRDLAQKRT